MERVATIAPETLQRLSLMMIGGVLPPQAAVTGLRVLFSFIIFYR
jgi:hypothetical protein